MKSKSLATRQFYDAYWPANVPDYTKTRTHVLSLLPEGEFGLALDGGCGTGVCSLALAERGRRVVAFDQSRGSLRTAQQLARHTNHPNILCCQGTLLQVPFPDETFDLVFSWGVIHHTKAPVRALDELVRILKPGGYLILAVYQKTIFTPIHELSRHLCLNMPACLKRPFISSMTHVARLAEALGKNNKARADNRRIESEIEDWFFVPEKHFFSPGEMEALFRERRLAFELLCPQTGRFKGTSNFIVRGQKTATQRRTSETA